jgi:hypothetical protein
MREIREVLGFGPPSAKMTGMGHFSPYSTGVGYVRT